MKKHYLLLAALITLAATVFADGKDGINWDMPDGGILVLQAKRKVKSGGLQFSYAFASGDKIIIRCATSNGKKLKSVKIMSLNSKVASWKKENFAVCDEEVTINREGVYTIEFDAKAMGARKTEIAVCRVGGKTKDYNFSWMKFNSYKAQEEHYNVDSITGYKAPVITQKELKIFDRYLYQNVNLFKHSKQIKGQGGVHNSQAVHYNLGIDPYKIPKNAKLKCYNYSLSSILGGANHWKIADITATAGAMFLSPAASFAAHGAMSVLGPQPGNEPVQYYMSNRESDIKVAKEIFSLHNDGRKVTNDIKDGVGTVAGALFGGGAKNAVKGTKVHEYSERDMSFNQKGKVTNLFVSSAQPPTAKCIIMGNPDAAKAKNTKLQANAIYYAPVYKKVKAEERFYEITTETLAKTKLKFSKTETYRSINF